MGYEKFIKSWHRCKVVNYQYMDRILVNISLSRNNTSAIELPLVLARLCSALLSNHHCRFDPSLSQWEMVCKDGFLNNFVWCKFDSKPCLHVETGYPNMVVNTLVPKKHFGRLQWYPPCAHKGRKQVAEGHSAVLQKGKVYYKMNSINVKIFLLHQFYWFRLAFSRKSTKGITPCKCMQSR